MILDNAKEENRIVELEISSTSSNGDGIARLPDGRICFVSGALPGEFVRARFIARKKDYATMKAIRILRASPDRTAPRCPWFANCGGCHLQHMKQTAQLVFKREAVTEALRRQGGFKTPDVPVESCRPSPQNWGYRNKAAFPVAPSRKGAITGFYQEGSHWIVPIDRCPILDPELEKAYRIVRTHLQQLRLTPYDERNHRGQLRHIVLRRGTFSGEGLIALVMTAPPARNILADIRTFFTALKTECPSIHNGILNINPGKGNFIWGPRTVTVTGRSFLHETLDSFSFRLEASAFFQINSPQALNLYRHVAQEAAAPGCNRCLELFSGTGSLTSFLAPLFQQLSAVESWQDAVKGLRHNLQHNGLGHVEVHAEAAESFMAKSQPESFDVIVLDPPRSGCRAEVLQGIIKVAPKRIVYVSCNPATLARDLKVLVEEGGFMIRRITPFDMFPQTHHVETVVTMEAAGTSEGLLYAFN